MISIVLALIYVSQSHRPYNSVTSFPQYSTSQQPNEPFDVVYDVPLMDELVPDINKEFHDYLSRYNKDYSGNK